MAGLTDEGFTPLSQSEIKTRIEGRLEVLNPGFDFSPESPDGQLIEIFGFEIAQLWTQLGLVFTSFDPRAATGQALRNLGLLSGILKDNADRSYATIGLVGTTDVIVPAGNIVSDADGNQFATEFDAVIPSNVGAIAQEPGAIVITSGTLVNIVTPIAGWDSITQTTNGSIGSLAETDEHYRSDRNRSVMNPSESVADALLAKLVNDLGLTQVELLNNDTALALADGTPAGHIHITVAETTVTDLAIAQAILNYKSLGTPTHGSTAVIVNDAQGNPHTINFTKATEFVVEIELTLTYLSDDNAGAELNIKAALVDYVNSLLAGEDVIWSRMFGLITPYGKAQVDLLEIGLLAGTLLPSNISISETQFATLDAANITFL